MSEVAIDNGDKFKVTDYRGRTWDLTLNLGLAERIYNSDYSAILTRIATTDEEREALSKMKIDLIQMTDAAIMQVIGNERLIYAICYTIVIDQLKANGIDGDPNLEETQFEFMQGINGQIANLFRETLWKSVIDFRPQMGTVLSRSIQINNKLKNAAPERVDRLMKEFETKIGPYLDKIESQAKANMEENMKTLGKKSG